jgi:demethylspheroidene O-methyltransferase
LAACLRLGLLDCLAQGPRTTADLAEELSLPVDATERLLRAAEALDLADRVGEDRYALGAQGAVLIGNPGLADMVIHHETLYADLADSVGLLRRRGGGGRLAAYWPYATSVEARSAEACDVRAYSALMAASLPTLAADVLDVYPLERHRLMMDIGGGEGVFLATAGARAPRLRLRLFDLPAVTRRARKRLVAAGLADRTDIVAGDFLSDPIPAGADLITLIRILHDHDDSGALRLLRALRAAITPDGVLLIAEPMSGATRPDRVADVYFAFYLLAMGRGRARTPTEIIELLQVAGFRKARLLKTRTPLLIRAILAEP